MCISACESDSMSYKYLSMKTSQKKFFTREKNVKKYASPHKCVSRIL